MCMGRRPVFPAVAEVQWTVPGTGNYTISTCGSTVDTILEFNGYVLNLTSKYVWVSKYV